MENITFRKATINDLDQIVEVCKDVVNFMINELKLNQWSSNYPNKEDFLKDIKQEELYLLISNETNQIIGFICINDQVYEQYNQVIWEENKDFKVLHRVAINPMFHKQGYGSTIYKLAMDEIKNNNIAYVRVDTFSENIPMNNTIKKVGFTFKGQMDYRENMPPWNCYEIKLNIKH